MNSLLKLAYEHGTNIALGGGGMVKRSSSLRAPLATAGLGGALGAWASNQALPENATTGERIMSGITGGVLGAGGALTGKDRFGLLGGLAGASLGAGAGYGFDKIQPEGEGILPMAGRALAQGTKGSLGFSLLASSLMPGAGMRAGIKALMKKKMSPADFEQVQGEARKINLGRPMSTMYGRGGSLGMEPPLWLDKTLKTLDYNTGSPTMAALAKEFGGIDKIPALKYIGGNLKDVAAGTAVGATLLPLSLPGQAIAEVSRDERRAFHGSLADKARFLAKHERLPADV
jgi:hypothetical protein